MKAIEEIGAKKAINYFLYSLWHYLFSLMFVSPLRVFLLELFGARIGRDTVIERIKFINLYNEGLSGLVIGERCFLGDDVVLDMAGKITMGDDVTLSSGTFVLTHTNVGYKNHPLQKSIPRVNKSVNLKNGVFVGVRAVIMPGVVVGEKSAVGALALVNRDVKKSTLVAGIPAKQIGRTR